MSAINEVQRFIHFPTLDTIGSMMRKLPKPSLVLIMARTCTKKISRMVEGNTNAAPAQKGWIQR